MANPPPGDETHGGAAPPPSSSAAGGRGSPTVRGMYQLFIGNMTFTVLLAVTAIVVGRILGPAGYGLYSVALIVPPFLFTVVRLGLDSAATRYAAKLRSEGKEAESVSFVQAAAIFGTVIATAATLVFIGLSGWVANSVVDRPELAGVVIPIALVSVIGEAAFSITDFGLTGLGRFDRSALLQALQGATKLVTSVGLVLLGFGVAGAVAGYTASFVVSGAIGLVYIGWLGKGRLPREMRSVVVTGVRYAAPIYASTLVSGFVTPVLYTVLALSVSDSQIGGYAEAATFNNLMGLLTYPITTALFPLFSRSVFDRGNLGRTYQKAVRYTALFVTPVAAFILAFSSPLMVTLYGESYAFAAAYLGLFAVISLLGGLGSLAWNSLLNGIGRTRDALWTTAAGSVVSAGTGAALIGAVGAPGAIAGLILGGTVSLAVGTWMVRKDIGAGPQLGKVWKYYAASGLAAAASAPVAWVVAVSPLALVAGGALFILVFIPLLALLSALDDEDIDELRGFLGFSRLVLGAFELAVRYYRRALAAFHGGRRAQR